MRKTFEVSDSEKSSIRSRTTNREISQISGLDSKSALEKFGIESLTFLQSHSLNYRVILLILLNLKSGFAHAHFSTLAVAGLRRPFTVCNFDRCR